MSFTWTTRKACDICLRVYPNFKVETIEQVVLSDVELEDAVIQEEHIEVAHICCYCKENITEGRALNKI